MLDLGLTEDQFYEQTPRQLDFLIKRYELNQERQEFLFGQVAAVMANFSMCRPKEPVSALDFMPSQRGKPKPKPAAPKRVKMTKAVRQQVTDSVRAGFGALIARNHARPNISGDQGPGGAEEEA